MLFKHLVVALLSAGTALALPSKPLPKRSVSFNFGQDKVRGVNIGGWLVLEPWITPSIFQKLNGVVDEYTLTQQLGQDGALSVLKPHWDNWVSISDFQKIAKAGFNTVRIPVGYWAFKKYGEDPYVQGAAPYLERAIGWARSTGLKVWIDLHGAAGSQNGFDNSGQRTSNIQFLQGGTAQHTLGVLQQISEKYAKQEYQDVVVAIELINEPLPPKVDLNSLRQFYHDGYDKVRGVSDTPVVLSDAFQAASSWNGFLSPSDNGAWNVIVDHHDYQVFSPDEVSWSHERHRREVCNRVKQFSNTDKWTIVGEWSAAMTDCAAALNGYGIGARYEGYYPGSSFVGSCQNINFMETWNQQFRDDTRAYIEAQLNAYEKFAQGWIFWNFKTEGSPEWDAFRLLDAGIFPQPLTDRKFQTGCQ
ncbi:MAG: exo-1,3-beta-glucanase [Peltula sp. TS41687]|nr:MAG: exo-1,3-beta-glucanase [Peltula sp. TS41687]